MIKAMAPTTIQTITIIVSLLALPFEINANEIPVLTEEVVSNSD